jgi:hypothetical protein
VDKSIDSRRTSGWTHSILRGHWVDTQITLGNLLNYGILLLLALLFFRIGWHVVMTI